jgi:ribosomal protein S7
MVSQLLRKLYCKCMMTNKKEVAQKIWDTYCEGYSEALMTPVESFSTYLDKDSRKIIASVLREVITIL